MIELLPCPFCGSNEVELWVNFDETTDKEREVELYSADGEYPEYSMYAIAWQPLPQPARGENDDHL